jgi:hypothetical protein
MYLGKKRSSWNIKCCLLAKIPEYPEDVRLSFTMEDFRNFIPPDGKVTQFSVHAELRTNHPKLKLGIYTDEGACCFVWAQKENFALHAVSDNWDTLRSFLCKILSEAGMRPKIDYVEEAVSHEVLAIWTRAITEMSRK